MRWQRVSARPIGLGLGGSSPLRHGGDEVGQADEGNLGPWGPSRGLHGPDDPEDHDGMEKHGADYGGANHIVRKTSEPVAPVEGGVSPKPAKPSVP